MSDIGRFSIIFASDAKRGIGYRGFLPWVLPEDISIFRKKITDKVVLMGRKTAETLPKIPASKMYVLTSNTSLPVVSKNSYFYIRSIDELLQDEKHVYVIGGAKVFEHIFGKYHHLIGKIHHTLVQRTYISDTIIPYSVFSPCKYDILSTKKYDGFTHAVYLNQPEEDAYLKLMRDTITTGYCSHGRNGFTHSVFGKHLQFNLIHSFPLITTKKMFWRGIVEELLMFIKGKTDTKELEEKGITIWSKNTSEKFIKDHGLTLKEGDMGPMYGYQWRNFNKPYVSEDDKFYKDQLKYVVDTIRSDPHSRRIMMTTFNPAQVDEGVLYPCHSIVTQFKIEKDDEDGKTFIDTYCYNRSSDLFLGLPFNIASTALLVHIIGKLTGTIPRHLTIGLGDAHVYFEHTSAVKTQIDRTPLTPPTLNIIPDLKEIDDIDNLKFDDFVINDYRFHTPIKTQMVA